MYPKIYDILAMCVENGVQYGYHRAYKHTDVPTKEEMCDKIYDAVMSSIVEYFNFGEQNE